MFFLYGKIYEFTCPWAPIMATKLYNFIIVYIFYDEKYEIIYYYNWYLMFHEKDVIIVKCD